MGEPVGIMNTVAPALFISNWCLEVVGHYLKHMGELNVINTLSGIMFGIGFSLIILFFYSLSKHRNRVSGIFSIVCLTVAMVSIGIATATSNKEAEMDINQLINEADMALYYAKNNGRNRVCPWSVN